MRLDKMDVILLLSNSMIILAVPFTTKKIRYPKPLGDRVSPDFSTKKIKK